ncbi:NAD(P)-dependent oxidoreductase [Sphingomonas sp.]|jgi:dTDP-glucose 4,6-dehydratase|uniref:NAD-dependent epimerase/dehydratase family protein n=1 Tax=Sphingomonas sp. TaxID=28214 RepID=UPI002D7F48D3|nr:NAD(P)-dependent oxidoreductase [Sphingomonas sp.]HEU0044475.1 NAD(P)-dependent oxidoreductase [Sphingomonas sp.]
MSDRTFADDIDAAVDAVGDAWRTLSGKRLLVTGGTGFIGRWMLEALLAAEHRYGLGAKVRVLSRDPAAFARKAPHLAAAFELVAGDVLTLPASGEPVDYVLHAAADASAELNRTDPARMFDTVVTGTRRVLDHAVAARATRLFFLSSGAVYGAQPWDTTHVGEDWLGGPDPLDPRNAYAEAKRAAELLGAIYRKQHGLEVVNARIFAVLGPLLSLDTHFAAGNFIRDALAGRTVRVEGAGTAMRSYLYAGDLTAWLWTILLRAAPGSTYNVGSEEAVSIADLARRTAALLGDAGHEVLGRPDPGWNPGRYVPATALIRRDLGVRQRVDLDEAIRRTAASHGWRP